MRQMIPAPPSVVVRIGRSSMATATIVVISVVAVACVVMSVKMIGYRREVAEMSAELKRWRRD